MATRVLLADDDADVLQALGAVIESEPWLELVGAAGDVDGVIELARLHRPDVALIDVKMPEGGGQRAVREIARCSPQTRMVAISAYDDRGSVFGMLRAGAVGYLVKGASANEICDTIARSLRGESVLSPEVASEVVHELAGHLEEQSSLEQIRRERVERVQETITGGAVRAVFQPIVELESGEPIGFEALARFTTTPERGPEAWFAEASSVGLRTELELAALRSALIHFESLPSAAFLSVNLSPTALLAPVVRQELDDAPPERLVIEVTEHAPIEDYDALAQSLRELRSRSVRLAIDDAGAGFASLRHVLRLAPDMIKVDGFVIRATGTDKGARALTRALVTFALEMGQLVIAEGIEKEHTMSVLQALGVQYGQGHLIGRPGDLPTG